MKTFKFLLIAMGWFFLQGCNPSGKNDSHTGAMEGMADHHMDNMEGHDHQEMAPASEPTGMSLYNVDSEWKNQHNETLKLNALQGKIQVVSMIYAGCQYACPRIIADMEKIKSGLPATMAEKVNFMLITIDPERDTPAKLKEFAREKELHDNAWLLLNGKSGDVREMAALLGINYKKTGTRDFKHSNIITVLNQKGEIAYQQKGLGQHPDASINKVRELLGNH